LKELLWTYLLGWQRVALGLLIIAVAVFFPDGIAGVMRSRQKRVGAPSSEGAPQ
jgi:branched-chain amino acid transport system permease protein